MSASAPSSYQPLARRYRPAQFEGPRGVVGQPHVVRTLKNAIVTHSVAQAYLLAGPRGTGKTTSARVLAAALNCDSRGASGFAGEPCAACPSCQRILTGAEVADVVEIDAATNRSVDDARALRERAMYAPSGEDRYKVYIIDEAHMLTREAWNALLKILEEPPARVVFVFATTEPQKIAQAAEAVLSRCQRLDFRRITHADLATQLRAVSTADGITVDDEALALIARHAAGGMRDALSTLDQLRAFQGQAGAITAETMREAFGTQPESTYLGVLDLLVHPEARLRTFRLVGHLDRQGVDFVRFLDELQETLEAQLLVLEGGEPEGWSPKALTGFQKRAGRDPKGGQWVATRPPQFDAPLLVDLLRLCQAESRTIRQARRPGRILLTLLQDAITRVQRGRDPIPPTPTPGQPAHIDTRIYGASAPAAG